MKTANNPPRITGVLPLASEIAPENSCIIAFGIVAMGIIISKSFGLTLNSVDRVPKKPTKRVPSRDRLY